MKRALLDILFCTFVVFFGLFLAHFYMYQKGLSRPIKNRPTGWWTGKFVVAQELTPVDFNFSKIEQLNNQFKDLDVLVIGQITISASDPHSQLNRVERFLNTHKRANLLINVLAYQFAIDRDVTKVINNLGASKRVIIRSPYDNIIREIFRQQPYWNLGIGDGEASRLMILSSLALETFPPVSGAFYFSNRRKFSVDLSPRLLAELRRRQIVIFAETPDSKTEWQKSLEQGTQGIITPSAENFLRWYKDQKL